MPGGVRVELKVSDPPDCTVTRATGAVDTSSDSVSKAVAADRGRVTEEFMLGSGHDSDGLPEELSPVFEYGDRTAYRFEREVDLDCPCEIVEAHDCPVVDAHCRGFDLFLTFHAPDVDRLQAVVRALRDRYDSLDVRRLLRTSAEDPSGSRVLVDRGVLTDRQREVLETAHEMGYFDHPKRVNASEVADALEISPSTFAEHLAAAQRKLLDAILDA